tara:strand:+ start:428 stop:712 length:285 start_codon:yes stop_codon:yes gene_type:complete
MKKIKLTVAALLLSSTCYSQVQIKNDALTKKIAYIESKNTLEDMIEWVRADIKTGEVRAEIGQSYVENLYELLSRLEDINAGYVFNCENCDEID